MNLKRIPVATVLLLSYTLIHSFQADAFNSDFQSNQNTSQLKLQNGTLLDGVGSTDADNESTSFVKDNPRLPEFNLSLKAFADKSQSAEFLEPKSVPENANTMSPTVEKTPALREYHQENPDNKDKRDFSGTGGERDGGSSKGDADSTVMNSATEILGEQEITVTGQQVQNTFNLAVERTTASTDDPLVQPGLLPVDGVGSSRADKESAPLVKDNQRFPDFSTDLKDFADKFQSLSFPEPKSVPENTNTVSPKVEETSAPRDHLKENPGMIGKRDFPGADGVPESPATQILVNAEQGVTVSGQREQNSADLVPTDDPPAQPDKLLLTRLTEINSVKDKESSGAGQHRAAAVHEVAMFISVMTVSCLIHLLLK